jgi:hypothetical protein
MMSIAVSSSRRNVAARTPRSGVFGASVSLSFNVAMRVSPGGSTWFDWLRLSQRRPYDAAIPN